MTERYTHGHGDAVVAAHRWRSAENSAGYLLPRLGPGLSVLDVGCGPGTITADLARLVAPGEVTGVDRSAEVVDAAAAAHAETNLRFTTGDLYALDAEDGSVDVVHAHQVLQHLGDPVRALVEMRRVCRPGGVVAVRDADYGAMTWWPELPGLARWQDVIRAVMRANGGEPDAGRHLVGWARAAGFGDVEASASTWCFATPEDRRWWGGRWAERTTGADLADRAVELVLATTDELAACAEAWREWAEVDGACFVVPHGEVLATP